MLLTPVDPQQIRGEQPDEEGVVVATRCSHEHTGARVAVGGGPAVKSCGRVHARPPPPAISSGSAV